MSELQKPDYRVRLFLSVDLTGSTAFKSKPNHSSFEWLKAFQHFYGGFPPLFNRKYEDACNCIPEISDNEKQNCPKIWKTIGDEILFVNRVNSITHLGAYVSAFSEALKEFGVQIAKHDLNTKGNAWVAAFPSPNCSIGLTRNGSGDPLAGLEDLPTEAFELEVDDKPSEFDFLGKGIDGGFRISKNSTIDTFTISPALAFLLCRARRGEETTQFDAEFRFHEPQHFKGVLNGKRYPIISIDTNRDPIQKEVSELEARLLRQPGVANLDDLYAYLKKYIGHNNIEMPALRLSDGATPISEPAHYESYVEQWEADYKQTLDDEAALSENPEVSEADDQKALEAPRKVSDQLFQIDSTE